MVLRRACYVVVVVACLGVGGCSDSEGANVTASSVPVRQGPVLEMQLARVAAAPADGGWLLENVDDRRVVNHVDAAGLVQRTQELPPWDDFDILGLPDGRLVMVGLRCEPVQDCPGTVWEIAWVSADGQVSAAATISSRAGERPDELPWRIVGYADGLLWLGTVEGLLGIDDEGHIQQGPEGDGGACVIDDGLYWVSESDRSNVIMPTADPENPVTYSVTALVDGKVEEVEDARFEGPSNSIGQCTPSGFEVYVSTKTESSRWTPASGWFDVDRSLDPVAPRSTHALGILGGEFIVDEAGLLLTRNEAGQWEPTDISFESMRPNDQPPLGLGADSFGDAVVACLEIRPTQHEVECHVGRSR